MDGGKELADGWWWLVSKKGKVRWQFRVESAIRKCVRNWMKLEEGRRGLL